VTNPVVHLLRGLIWGYRLTLSPFIGRHCRFDPTCSHYALEALSKHGALRGSLLTLRRLARCHPWGGQGYDPVPDPKGDDPCGDDHNTGGPEK
jgi:uncharacterized protein